MTGNRKHVKAGRLVVSTVRQPAGAPLIDSCTTIGRREHRAHGTGKVLMTEDDWVARGYALRLFTPPAETRSEALTVTWIGAPLPPNGPMIRARLRGLRRRLKVWPLSGPIPLVGQEPDFVRYLERQLRTRIARDFCGR